MSNKDTIKELIERKKKILSIFEVAGQYYPLTLIYTKFGSNTTWLLTSLKRLVKEKMLQSDNNETSFYLTYNGSIFLETLKTLEVETTPYHRWSKRVGKSFCYNCGMTRKHTKYFIAVDGTIFIILIVLIWLAVVIAHGFWRMEYDKRKELEERLNQPVPILIERRFKVEEINYQFKIDYTHYQSEDGKKEVLERYLHKASIEIGKTIVEGFAEVEEQKTIENFYHPNTKTYRITALIVNKKQII